MSRYKVAISESGERVSHRFDYAHTIYIIELEDGKEVRRQSVSTENMNGIQMMRQVINSGAEAIICGAMPCFYHRMADSVGIKVIFYTGDIESATVAAGNSDQPAQSAQPRRGHGRRCGMNNAARNRNGCRARIIEREDSVDSKNDGRVEDA
ncbi:MAG: hypothetical protein BWY28_00412 [bacterium ADurb.Bin236]|nr:MAG: hypothetical protein BWY28_00412 [bacterium ADurb.Bin236]